MESGPDPVQPGAFSRLRAALKSAWPALVLVGGAAALGAGIVVGIVTRPKPDIEGPLKSADRMIGRGDFQQALDLLNKQVLPVVQEAWISEAQRGRYHREVARAVYLGQRDLGIHDATNDETVRREFLAAEDLGVTLSPEDVVFLCDSYVALGQEDRAVGRVMKLPASASEQRRTIMRRLVENELAKPRPEFGRAIDLLTQLSGDADLSPEDRAWSLARETEIRLGQGFAGEAVSRLLQGIMRLEKAPAGALAELYTLLGTAYYQLGEFETAIKQLERAGSMLGKSEPMAARVETSIAMSEQSLGRLAEARERYADVVSWSDGMEWQVRAQFGLAETEGLLGRPEESIDAYSQVVESLKDGKPTSLLTPERVAASLLNQASDRLAADDPQSALRLVLRAEELFSSQTVPADVLWMLAVAHEKLAERGLGETSDDDAGVGARVAKLDPTTRETVQRHFIASGQYYARYADAVNLSDNNAYAEALWSGAQAYDAGGDYEHAVRLFREFVEGVPDDPSATGRRGSRAEGRYRLGRAYQARGEYELAAGVFEALISDGELEGDVGQYAAKSYVPLAQTYLADRDETNDEEARSLLLQAVSGKLGDEGSAYFHDALLELAALHHRKSELVPAIERLREAIERYPEDPEILMLKYRLADSLRQEASSIERSLATEARPDAEAVSLEQARQDHLRESLTLFAEVRDGLSAEPPERATESRRVALRNSFFFLGDCAFDLGDYEAAVRHYETARERYAKDPASLVGMVQIVNAYVAMGELDRARAANERARRFYATLPEDAWSDPYLPMSREDWERWLDSTAELFGFGGEQ
ncbi:MAG: tetratricopeptide repeat protein [Phycisphaerales bacterium]|nr:tetratricopeptide repeat protein [Phycisphaerales bacterium]